jgi:hypothetical protein
MVNAAIIKKHRYPLHKTITNRWPLGKAQAALGI